VYSVMTEAHGGCQTTDAESGDKIDAPSPCVVTKFAECGLGGQNLPIDIAGRVVMVRHRGPDSVDRWHGRQVVSNDIERASCQRDVVENGKP
jgi:hypothetical protein